MSGPNMEDVEGFEQAKQPTKRPVGGCVDCKKQNAALEAKLDSLIARLNPLIEFAHGFMESPTGRLYKAMTRRKSGGAG